MIGGAYPFILSLSLPLTKRLPPLPLQICTEEYGSKGGLVKKLEQITKEYYWNEKNKIHQRIELKEKMGKIG